MKFIKLLLQIEGVILLIVATIGIMLALGAKFIEWTFQMPQPWGMIVGVTGIFLMIGLILTIIIWTAD